MTSRQPRWRRITAMTPDIFWSLLRRGSEPDSCWTWPRSCVTDGYGAIQVRGRRWQTHRYAWTLINGPIPAGKEICHRCDNPPCCRPDHLFAATHADNNRDCQRKERRPPVIGERNPMAKLSETEVLKIREMYAHGISQKRIATGLNLKRNHVFDIVKRRIWKHI